MPKDSHDVALVTDGCRPVGRAIMRGLAARGWAVAIQHGDRDGGSAGEAAALVREIRAAGGRADAFGADPMREAEVRALVPAVAAGLGPPVLLVTNTGPGAADDIGDIRRETWELNLEAGLRAPVVLAGQFARHLPKGTDGNVINILDRRAAGPAPGLSSTLAQAGVLALTRSLAAALAPRIRVNGIGLGPPADGGRPVDLERDLPAALGLILDTPSMTGQVVALGGRGR